MAFACYVPVSESGQVAHNRLLGPRNPLSAANSLRLSTTEAASSSWPPASSFITTSIIVILAWVWLGCACKLEGRQTRGSAEEPIQAVGRSEGDSGDVGLATIGQYPTPTPSLPPGAQRDQLRDIA